MTGNEGTVFKAGATGCIWFLATGMIALVTLFVDADAVGGIFMVLLATIVSTGFVWNWGRADLSTRKNKQTDALGNHTHHGKRKNQAISQRLRDYSDEELISLRERVTRGEISEDELSELLS